MILKKMMGIIHISLHTKRREKREKKTSTIEMKGSKDAMLRSQDGRMAQKREGT